MATTTTQQGVPMYLYRPEFDLDYLKSMPGIIKLAQAALCLLGFIFCATSYPVVGKGWYEFVTMLGFFLTMILVVCYVLHVVENVPNVPWLMIETIYTGLWAFFLLVASAILIKDAGRDGGRAAAVFFGFAAMVAFGVECYLKFMAWRNGSIPQESGMNIGPGMHQGGGHVNMPPPSSGYYPNYAPPQGYQPRPGQQPGPIMQNYPPQGPPGGQPAYQPQNYPSSAQPATFPTRN